MGTLFMRKPRSRESASLARRKRDARLLIELVGGDADAVMDFRVIAESKAATSRLSNIFRSGARLPRMRFRGILEERWSQLDGANAAGMAVYYGANESDGNGVKSENIKAVRVLPVDLDGTPPPDVWPVEPHLLMESSPGRHQALLMVEPTIDFELASNLIKRLAYELGGDATVNDRARVLRLPGFNHQKGTPFTSRILDVNHFRRAYKLAELDGLLPPLPRRFVNADGKGIGIIGVDKAKLLFANLDPQCLDGNENWQRFAMALHSACNGDQEVAELFFDFCSTADGYGDEGTDALNRVRWESFDASRENRVGIGTLRHLCLKFRVPGLVIFQLFNTAKRDFDDE